MTRKQFTLNVIFFIPLMIANFFAYGVNGCVEFVKLLREY